MKKLLLLCLVLVGCNDKTQLSDLQIALESTKPSIQKVMEKPEYYELQVLYTNIEKDENGKTVLVENAFLNSPENYFYPASTVKLPVALVALEYIDGLDGVSFNTEYTMTGDTIVHSIKDDIRQIFAVSDNEAYNRLYNLLGRDEINARLRKKRIAPVRIAHRLETDNPAARQCDTLFFKNGMKLGAKVDSEIEKIKANKLQKGVGFIKDSTLVSEPMDFSEKNYFPLQTQHKLMKRLFFEDNFKVEERFNFSSEARVMLLTAMHTVPRKQGYDEGIFYDGYVKFFMYGDTKGRIQDQIKVYNKVGYAYGTLTETAYITDSRNDINFILSSTILVNENKIFNDDNYDYSTIGIPFMAELGRELYGMELIKKRDANKK